MGTVDGLSRDVKFCGRIEGKRIYGYYYKNTLGMHNIVTPATGMTYEVQCISIGQYTGLEDKNGVEIYEGDIVQTEGYIPHIVKREDRLHGVDIYGYNIADECEVVGNIFENPELLDNPNETTTLG